MMHISMYKNYTEEIIEGSDVGNFLFDDYNYEKIIDMYGINFRDAENDTALIWACYDGNAEIVESLLEVENIDVNLLDNFGRTALIWACFCDNVEIFRLLLEVKNIDVNIHDEDGGTALIWTCVYKNVEIIKLLEDFIKTHQNDAH